MRQQKTRKRRRYRESDMTVDDNRILSEAYALSFKNPNSFICFAHHYTKLRALSFINGENVVTSRGIDYLRDLYEKQERQRKRKKKYVKKVR